MNIETVNDYMIPIITIASLCIGYVLKKWMPADDKWIPTILLILGALSGLVLFGANYEGVVKGMVSGLAAVGLHQVFKQHLKLDESQQIQTRYNNEDFSEMVEGETNEETHDTAEE